MGDEIVLVRKFAPISTHVEMLCKDCKSLSVICSMILLLRLAKILYFGATYKVIQTASIMLLFPVRLARALMSTTNASVNSSSAHPPRH